MTALTDLAAAWERGDLHLQPYGGMPMATACYPRDANGHMLADHGGWSDGNCMSAYHGSVDAALRMKDGLLPGAEIDHMQQFRSLRKWRVRLGVGRETFTAEAATPARALGLAVIRALVAKEGE